MCRDCDSCEHAWIKHSTRWEPEDSGCDLEHEMTQDECDLAEVGKCPYFSAVDPYSLSDHSIKIPIRQCACCCKSEVRTVLSGSIFSRAVVCDYNYPDDPGILDCVIKGECPYYSPASTKRVTES